MLVDVVDFNERPGSTPALQRRLHLVEPFPRTGPDHIRYEATIEDPKVFTRPWKMSMPLYRRQEPNVQLLEYDCAGYLDDGK